jgi:hypothetical protein
MVGKLRVRLQEMGRIQYCSGRRHTHLCLELFFSHLQVVIYYDLPWRQYFTLSRQKGERNHAHLHFCHDFFFSWFLANWRSKDRELGPSLSDEIKNPIRLVMGEIQHDESVASPGVNQ